VLYVKSSMQHDEEAEEEAHIPLNPVLISNRNPMQCAMEEEACIDFY
jgi:hypothetical protein